MAATLVANGDYAAVKAPSGGRCTSVYSEVQNSRLDHSLPLPSVLKSSLKVVDGPPSSAAGNPGKHRNADVDFCANLRAHAIVSRASRVCYECWICSLSEDFFWSSCVARSNCFGTAVWTLFLNVDLFSVRLSVIQCRDLMIVAAIIFCCIVETW